MPACEVGCIASVDDDGALLAVADVLVPVEGRDAFVLVQQPRAWRLRLASCPKYAGCGGLALRDQVDERFLAHGLERVVRAPLLADVETVSVDSAFPHADPAPCAGRPA